ncbi:MAG TPA: hypothetical protein PLH94_07740 [Fimbriimonadaceae bacterium]|nr:hypothetical protein [Fimbriimonadaceae bacterium]
MVGALLAASAIGFGAIQPPFSAIERVHGRMKAATLVATSVSLNQGAKLRQRFEIGYARPDRVRVAVKPLDGTKGRWTLWGSPQGMTILDEEANKYASAPWNRRTDLATNVEAQTALDGFLLALIEPTRMRDLLGGLRQAKPWTSASDGAGVSYRHESPNGSIVLRLDRSNRVAGLELGTEARRVTWTVSYAAAPKSFTPKLPGTATRAGGAPDSGPPEYGDAKAKPVLNKAIVTYDRLRRVQMRTTSDEGSRTLWISDGWYRERQTSLEWSYVNGTLTIIDRGRSQWYRGKVGKLRIADALGKLGTRMEPMMWSMLQGRNPVQVIFTPAFRVSVQGTVTIDGRKATILAGTAARNRITAAVRTDGLFASMTNLNVDDRGRTVATSERRFAYDSIGKAMPMTTFALTPPRGFRERKIGELLNAK